MWKEKAKAVAWSALYFTIGFMMEFLISVLIGFTTIAAGLRLGVVSTQQMDGINAVMMNMLTYLQGNNLSMIVNLLMEGLFFACFVPWYYFREKKYSYHPDYKRAFQSKNIFGMAGIAIFGQYALTLFMIAVYLLMPEVFEQYTELMKTLDINSSQPFLMLFCVGIFAPLVEEVLFRGMIFARLRRAFSFWPSAVISGVAFGIFHMNVVQGIYAAAFGVILAYVFEKTETLWGSYLLHAFFNLSSYLISGYEALLKNAGVEMPFIIQLLISVVSVPVVFLLLRGIGKRAVREQKGSMA